MAQLDRCLLGRIRLDIHAARDVSQRAGLYPAADASSSEQRLDHALQELQARVEQQHAALGKLRASSTHPIALPAADNRERLKQLLRLKRAYGNLVPSEPFLPTPPSALPALLTARNLIQTTAGTKEAIASTEEQLEEAASLLRREEANLNDASLLCDSMGRRIHALRAQNTAKTQRSAAQVAEDMISASQARKDAYDGAMRSLAGAFESFVEDHLAGMLAAEELGGPVVGDIFHVGDDTLGAGFTQRGKQKSAKQSASNAKRQSRIDQIWGDQALMDHGEQLTEAEAAGKELRRLVEELFTALTVPGGAGAYVQVERESAASRFLVRTRIAQLHPRDARRMRLTDFGRELDH